MGEKENSMIEERDLTRLSVPEPNTRQSGLTTAFITRLLSEIDFNQYNAKSILILHHYNSSYSHFFIESFIREAFIFGYDKDEIKRYSNNSVVINDVKITIEYCELPYA